MHVYDMISATQQFRNTEHFNEFDTIFTLPPLNGEAYKLYILNFKQGQC